MKFPLGRLLTWLNNIGSGDTAHMVTLAWTFAVGIWYNGFFSHEAAHMNTLPLIKIFINIKFDFRNTSAKWLIRARYGTEIKGKRKVQGVPQSQTAALPRHQEAEETDKSKQAQIEQTYENQ